MGGTGDSRRGRKAQATRRRVDGEAKAAFVAALREGMPRDEAARETGFTAESFYYARRRDAVFRFAWIWALELAAADYRASQSAASLWSKAKPGEIEIAPNNRRVLQARRVRTVRFTDKRKQLFLDHFAATADVYASAEAAGVHWSTVYRHRERDPEFAARWEAALRQAYAALEAEAVRQRLEAQRQLRASPAWSPEAGLEFERILKLLARFERSGPTGVREIRRGAERRWTFDEAIAELDRSLRALGARHNIQAEPIALPPPANDDE